MCCSQSISSAYSTASQAAFASGQSQVSAQIGIAVAAKALDATRGQGATVIALLQSAANVGRSVDSGKVLDISG